ncbi:MAG: SUMF1/EgtB/PvdO family nonheme iron enzyme, partial [Bacteroidales bacterium]|nr:SUMF1/EgtB/PvdO family nonheme iron enzyme [Bacteroidales bacterium]
MKKIFIILFSVLSLTAFGQKKKIALIEPRVGTGSTAVSTMEKAMIRGELRNAIVQFDSYDAITRTDLDQMMKEFGSGMVNESQRKKLGEMTGAQYVLVAEAAILDEGHLIITAKIIDVETARLSNTAYEMMGTGSNELKEGCRKLAATLLKVTSNTSVKPSSEQKSANISSNNNAGRDCFTETSFGMNMKMIWVEGGEFMMGCTSEQSDCEDDEKKVRRVKVDGFYIGMLEVTQAQWKAVMGTNPSYFKGDNLPIEQVSWEEAMEFCRKLSTQTGKTYTLPTEAQWEYAARGGKKNDGTKYEVFAWLRTNMAARGGKKNDGTKYAGSNLIDAVAWYSDNSGSSTHPCGSKRANALGIYDMSG